MNVVGRDDGHHFDSVRPLGLRAIMAATEGYARAGIDTERDRRPLGLLRVRREHAREQLIASVETRRHAVHRRR
jgi:hypothetical protein